MEQLEEKWLRSTLLPEILQNDKTANGVNTSDTAKSLKVRDISITIIGADEAFMMTKCYKAKINYEFCGVPSTCSLIVKKTPEVPEEAYESVGFTTLFSNEIYSYTTILPALIDFSNTKKKEATDGDGNLQGTIISEHSFPRYYYSELGRLSATIVLGDFNTDRWRMSASRVNLSLDHVLLAVKYLGLFHGISYALKEVDRAKFNSMIAHLKDSRYSRPPPPRWHKTMVVSVGRTINSAAKYYPEIPKEFLAKLSELLADCFDYNRRRIAPMEPYANLCHGDYLRNNVAYRYDNPEDQETPTDVIMFDLQTMCYSSPMIDLTVFLSLSSGRDVRPKHFDEIFTAYWDKLVSAYRSQTTAENLPDFMSRENLLKEYIRHLPFSLGIASGFLMTLYDPKGMNVEALLSDVLTEDQLMCDILCRGGDVVDKENASLVKDLYELSSKHCVNIFKGFL